MKELKNLIMGPISSEFMQEVVNSHQHKTNLGAHSMFIGTVRADAVDHKAVTGIEYSAYPDMMAPVIQEIKDLVFGQYPEIHCMHIYHSTGLVLVGEHSLLVMVSAGHRKEAIAACAETVELIKAKLPVWKKEFYSDGSSKWLEP